MPRLTVRTRSRIAGLLIGVAACKRDAQPTESTPPTGTGTETATFSVEPASVLEGDDALDMFGYVVDAAGDVDGDGFGDVLVGTLPAYGPGKVYLFRGSAQGLIVEPALVLHGTQEMDGFGVALAGAGDLDGDSYDDVLVSVPWGVAGGRVDAYHGSPDGLEATPTVSLTGAGPPATWGSRVAAAGDIDRDGFADALVAAWTPIDTSGTGSVELFRGSIDGLGTVPSQVWFSGDPNLSYGVANGVRDANGDGYDDVVVATSDPYGAGASVQFHPGSPTGLSLTPQSTVLYGFGYASGFGSASSPGFDVNGDGQADVLVGAPFYYDSEVSLSGEVFVLFGSPSGLDLEASMSVVGPDPAPYFGQQVAGMGDLDGDGFGDVAISAYMGGGGHGTVYVYRGSADGLEPHPTAVTSGGLASDGLGWSMANAGDVDGDGLFDLIAGAPMGPGLGRAYLYLGRDLGAVDR